MSHAFRFDRTFEIVRGVNANQATTLGFSHDIQQVVFYEPGIEQKHMLLKINNYFHRFGCLYP